MGHDRDMLSSSLVKGSASSPAGGDDVRRRRLRLGAVLLLLGLGSCDCIYPNYQECKDLDEAACLQKSVEGAGWVNRRCVVDREDGRFVKCAPIRSTGCGF